MKLPLLLCLAINLLTATLFAQNQTVNNYKYVIVPSSYDFLNESNKYRLNELTKFLFEKSGFVAVMDTGETLPSDLNANPCMALKADVKDLRAFLTTKLVVELRNCKNELIFTSDEGKSKEKEYNVAYNLALRDAFVSISNLNYKYEPNAQYSSVALNQNATAPITQQLTNEVNANTNGSAPPSTVNTPAAVVENQIENNSNLEAVMKSTDVLYAQKLGDGYQLVNSEPKVVYKIKPTTLQNVFLVDGKAAIIFKKSDRWMIEYYSGTTLKTEALNIKF